MTTTGTIDPNLQAPKTNEFIVTFDKQVSADFAVSGSFIYRKYTDFTTTSRPGITAANWTAKTYTPNCSTAPAGALCQPVTYYSPNFQLPVNTVLINQPDYYRLYKGAEVAFRKRMSQNWQINGSYSYTTAPQFFPTRAAYGQQFSPNVWSDPTMIRWSSRSRSERPRSWRAWTCSTC